jgi:hypothetical protein
VDKPKSYQVDVLCVDYPSHQQLHVVMKYFSISSHYFPCLYENYIILSPCHGGNSGETQILSGGCIVRRLPESSTVTCGYEALFYLIPLLSLLVRELYHIVSTPQ